MVTSMHGASVTNTPIIIRIRRGPPSKTGRGARPCAPTDTGHSGRAPLIDAPNRFPILSAFDGPRNFPLRLQHPREKTHPGCRDLVRRREDTETLIYG